MLNYFFICLLAIWLLFFFFFFLDFSYQRFIFNIIFNIILFKELNFSQAVYFINLFIITSFPLFWEVLLWFFFHLLELSFSLITFSPFIFSNVSITIDFLLSIPMHYSKWVLWNFHYHSVQMHSNSQCDLFFDPKISENYTFKFMII